MDPLWALCSGRFAGWRNGDVLYNTNGDNVGHFSGEVAYSLSGSYIGEMYSKERIGQRSTASHARRMSTMQAMRIIAPPPKDDQLTMVVPGWEDPDF